LKILRANVPNVLAEKGCKGYQPTVDVDSGIPIQEALRPDVVTLVEAWDSTADLKVHLQSPHMLEYREKTKDLVKRVVIQVMEAV